MTTAHRQNFRATIRRARGGGRMMGQTFATEGALARSDAADAKLLAERAYRPARRVEDGPPADDEMVEEWVSELCRRDARM